MCHCEYVTEYVPLGGHVIVDYSNIEFALQTVIFKYSKHVTLMSCTAV